MAGPQEKLAESLRILRELQERGTVAIRSAHLTRTHRERLLKAGFLQEVMKGWYIPARPDEAPGDSTAWYACFWEFCAAYLKVRFDGNWCLSPEQSICLYACDRNVPRQLLVRSPKARNKVTALAHDTSIFEVRATVPDPDEIEEKDGLRLFSLNSALISCAPGFFAQNPTDTRTALSMVRDASEVLAPLLDGGHSTIAGRLAGAFRNIGRERIAKAIIETMRAAGYTVRETDPFADKSPLRPAVRELSPHVNRVRLMWQSMRTPVIEQFPEAPGPVKDTDSYLKAIDATYVTDAYHSLSIEGYRVNPELIERVRSGDWNPDHDYEDREQRNALAARGYWQAFQVVRKSVERVLKGENPGAVAAEDHQAWYRELFAPSVAAGLIRPSDLAGYRSDQVFIKRSMHVPPKHESVRDLMPALFELLTQETEPAVRVVLGHFFFVYIHPYRDGNGRMARFLMNVMLAAGGYPWTIIRVDERDAYMAALEEASVGQNIMPFRDLLGRLVR